MTRRKWTTPEQETFLLEKRPEFRLAEAANTRKAFFAQLYSEWVVKWPTRAPNEQEITAARSEEQAIKELYVFQLERLKTWYRNNKRLSSAQKLMQQDKASSPSSAPIAFGQLKLKKKRTQQAWQAYHSLTYESKWKPIIDQQWATRKEEWKKNHPNTKMPETRFTFMNNFIKEKFENESDEVKKEVDDYRKRQAAESQPININKVYQQNIPKLPRTMTNIGASIEDQVGWFSTTIVGGPTPGDGGEINTFIYHHGTTPDGQNFEAFLGKELFQETIGNKFDDFLHTAFTPEMRAQRTIDDDDADNSDSEDERDTSTSKPNEGDVKEEGSTANGEGEEEEADPKGKGKETVDTGNEISEYERTRGLNIEQNKVLLQSMGLDGGSKRILLEEKAKNPRKKKGDPSTKQTAGETVKRTSPRNMTSAAVKQAAVEVTVVDLSNCGDGGKKVSEGGNAAVNRLADSNNATDMDVGKEGEATVKADGNNDGNNEVKTAPESGQPSDLPNGIESGGDVPAVNLSLTDANQELKTPSNNNQNAEQGSNVQPAEGPGQGANTEIMDVVEDGGDHSVRRQDNDIAPIPPIDPARLSDPAAIISNGSDVLGTSDSGTNTKPESVEVNDDANTPTSTLSQSNSNGALSSNSAANSNADQPMDDVKDNTFSIEDDMADAPGFLTVGVVEYLRRGSQHRAWQNLVTTYLSFEKKAKNSGKLTTQDRPDQVALWIRRHLNKKHAPLEVEPEDFGPQFLAWWKCMQPPGRVLPDGGFSKESLPEATWATVNKGGSAGLYIVVMALSWWVFSLGDASTGTNGEVWDVVDDFAWVLKQLQSFASASKRFLDTSDGVIVYKRGRRT